MKIRNISILLLFSQLTINSCKVENYLKTQKLPYVGDIEYNKKVDDPNFQVCNGENKILQYFNLSNGPQYIGEKPALLARFKTHYNWKEDETQNGLIRIRFIVNCEGKAGRFRTLESDFNLEEMKFERKIVLQLIKITKEIENWEIQYDNTEPIDYYFYLIFKIQNGQITEILP